MATLKDVAKRAGVSPAAASRVLNQDRHFSVSDDTRMKIQEAAKALDTKDGWNIIKIPLYVFLKPK